MDSRLFLIYCKDKIFLNETYLFDYYLIKNTNWLCTNYKSERLNGESWYDRGHIYYFSSTYWQVPNWPVPWLGLSNKIFFMGEGGTMWQLTSQTIIFSCHENEELISNITIVIHTSGKEKMESNLLLL